MYNILLFLLLCTFINSQMYLSCNQSQSAYFETEREVFGIADNESQFDYKTYSNADIIYFPTSCIDNGVRIEYPLFSQFLMTYVDKIEEPLTTNKYIPSSIINRVTNYIWVLMGYNLETHNNELYWHYKNNKTENVIIFFHGISVMNGLENLYLLRQFKKKASVFVSVYPQSFLTEHSYNTSYSQHINNVISFITTVLKTTQVELVGNSFGSIRITTLCKRYNCGEMKNIILTDPINLNFPYSILFKQVIHGVFANNKLTHIYRQITTVNVLRQEKHYNHLIYNLDWFEWSIDSSFMEYYKHNLVLVIGNYDSMIQVNKTCRAMTEIVPVIYTDTVHGFVLFADFYINI